jgi:single-strand DNA-binding protein
MASLNKVMLIGNVTRDPELRYTPKGTAVSEVGLAVNRRYRIEDEVREETTFVDVTFWGRQAETINQYLKKGNPFFVEGRLQLDSWEDKASGQKRSKLRVVGENFQFLGGGGGGGRTDSDAGEAASQAGSGGGQSHAHTVRDDPAGAGEEDEIPF